jgi:hypothetical protein
MGQGNHAGRNPGTDIPRSARHGRRDACAGRMQRGPNLFDHWPQARRCACNSNRALSAKTYLGRARCDCEIERVQEDARRSEGGQKPPNCAPNSTRIYEGKIGESVVGSIGWGGNSHGWLIIRGFSTAWLDMKALDTVNCTVIFLLSDRSQKPRHCRCKYK